MKCNKRVGIVLAATAASLFATATLADDLNNTVQAASSPTVKCQGINSCKGQAMCDTSSNTCKGENSCKGKGWINVTQQECLDKGGTILPNS